MNSTVEHIITFHIQVFLKKYLTECKYVAFT